jgi:predicted transcriptional regulator
MDLKDCNEILRKRVLYCIKSHPNITSREIGCLLSADILNVRPRLTELQKEGLIRDNGVILDPINCRRKVLKWVAC